MAKRAILAGVDAGATAHLGTDITQMLSYLLDGDTNSGSGVLNKSADHLEVTESATPAMTVDVTKGVGLIKDNNTDDFMKKLRIVVLDADYDDTLVVTANATGSNRIDAVVAYIDLNASQAVRGLDVLCFAVVAGTGTSAMSDAVVQTAVDALVSGYSDVPWMRLADLTVANGASSIVSANISDERTQAGVSKERILNQYLVQATLSTDHENLVDATWTDIVFDTDNEGTKTFDVGSNYNTTTGFFVAPVDGYYRVFASLHFTNVVANTNYGLRLYYNTSTILQEIYQQASFGPGGDDRLSLVASVIVYLSASDTVNVKAKSDSGDNTVDIASGTGSLINIEYIGK